LPIFHQTIGINVMAFLPMLIYQRYASWPLRCGICAYACPIMWCALPQRGFTFDSLGLPTRGDYHG